MVSWLSLLPVICYMHRSFTLCLLLLLDTDDEVQMVAIIEQGE